MDKRWQQLGDLLVNYATAVRPGERVMIAMGEVESLPLAESVCAAAVRAGAYTQVQFVSETLRHSLLKYGSAEQLAWVPEIEAYGMEWADVYIGLRGAFNLHIHSQIPAERLSINQAAMGKVSTLRWQKTRWCVVRVPNAAFAFQAEMDEESVQDMFFDACLLDWEVESRRWREWAQVLNRAANVRVVGRDTDLRFSVQGRTWIVGDGKFNMPDGEIHTAPITSTLDGQIYFEDPGVLGGRLMHDIRLRWDQGRLVEASASTNQDYLQSIVATDAGAGLIGEFAFGTNPHVTSFTKDILIDEKIGGTVHIALGRSYPESGGDNRSAIHWDIIKDIRREGAVYVDGRVVLEGGQLPSMTAAAYLIGIDIGTYSSKGVLVAVNPLTGDGAVVASHVTPHTIEMPQPGWVEQDADGVWWHDCVDICRQLLAQSGVDSGRIAALGISTTAPCVLPVGTDGRPLRPGILYGIDTRATAEIAELEAELGAEVLFERYGVKLSSQSTSPKLLWLRKHEPHVWARTHLLLSGAGYLVYRLTGVAVLDIYDAGAYAPLFDVRTCAWNPEMAGRLVSSERLPRLTWTCDVAGRVTNEASALTGLVAGTPVITGTADAAAEAISAGLAQVGDLMVMYGSSIFFILKTDRLYNSRQLWGTRFLEPNTYAVAGGMSTAGSLTRWFRDNFAGGELAAEAAGGANAYAALAELAASSPPGARGLIALPYFAGERTPIFDPDAKGLLIGLTLSHTRGDIYRALLEGVGFGIRHNLDAMRSEGMTPRRILAVGGGTLNQGWMQLVSDIAGIEQHIPAQQIGAAYGDAFLAGVGVGMFGGTRDAGRWVQVQQIVRPEADAHARYSQFYELYRQIYRETAESMHRLSHLA